MPRENTLKADKAAVKLPAEATGKNYMHPKYQRRIFFPELWTEEELKNWGAE